MHRLFFIVLLLSNSAFSETNQDLMESLTYNEETSNNVLGGDELIKRMQSNGIFPRNPSLEEDYSKYYIPSKDLELLGSSVLVFEHEELGRFIGCCPNPGNAVIVKINNNENELIDFSKKNKCKVYDQPFVMAPQNLPPMLSIDSTSKYITISCKDNYRLEYE